MKIESILCPIDLTPKSDESLRYAIALARAYDSELVMLHCVMGQPSADLLASDDLVDTIRQSIIKYSGNFGLEGLDWKTAVIAADDVGETIAHEASILRSDLIVMRSRRRPHRAALLGSTAETVSRNAPCPVLVMHSDERDWVTGSSSKIELKRVLVAYDFSDHSEIALKYGLSIAQEYQSELHLLHVLPPSSVNDSEISWHPFGKEGAYHQASRRLQKAIPGQVHLWCNVKHVVSEGQPYREILNYATRNEIDLICIGANGSGFGMQTLFGSNVDRVLRQAPCPVLVSRPLKPAVAIETTAEMFVATSV